MKLLVAIHGILTNQTDASWPDQLDAWMFSRDPNIKVIKKEYRAGPFPRWNCLVKDPAIARSLANELELFLDRPFFDPTPQPDLWFVAHSNGAIIALLTAQILAQRGYTIAGIILTGAACEADIAKNGVLELLGRGALDAAIAYSSHDDKVVPGGSKSPLRILYSALARPYGSLGRTGWLLDGEPLLGLDTVGFRPRIIATRYFPGGHSTYFAPSLLHTTFEQILQDINSAEQVSTQTHASPPNSNPRFWRN